MAFFKSFSSVPKFATKTSLTFGAVTAALDFSVQTFTVKGLSTDMLPVVKADGLTAGLFLVNPEVSAKDTLKLTVVNLTAGDVTLGAKTVTIVCL